MRASIWPKSVSMMHPPRSTEESSSTVIDLTFSTIFMKSFTCSEVSSRSARLTRITTSPRLLSLRSAWTTLLMTTFFWFSEMTLMTFFTMRSTRLMIWVSASSMISFLFSMALVMIEWRLSTSRSTSARPSSYPFA